MADENAPRKIIVNDAEVVVGNVGRDLVVKIESRHEQSQSHYEYRWRQKLLEKVRRIWLDDFLVGLLKEQELIEFEVVEKKYSVPGIYVSDDDYSSEPKISLSRYIEEADILGKKEVGYKVLILGDSGSGKTLTLLKLLQKFNQSREDGINLLPVMLNLSSWAKKKQPISKWLIEEIDSLYEISDQDIVKDWIRNQNLFLFFDGLDEVEESCQANCIRALQEFIKNGGLTPTVICCRSKDYDQISTRLHWDRIVIIQPLNLSQINKYLDSNENKLQALKRVIQKNIDLQKLARTPLNLRVMSIAFRHCSFEEISESLSGGLSQEKLWDIYIDQMFERNRSMKRNGAKCPYQKEVTLKYLSWIARYIKHSSQSRFLIERLQPSILLNQELYLDESRAQTKNLQRLCRCQSSLIFGGAMGVFGLFFGVSNYSPDVLPAKFQEVLSHGVLFGLVGFLVGVIVTGGLDDIQTVETIQWPIKTWSVKKMSFQTKFQWFFVGSLSSLLIGLLIIFVGRPNEPIKVLLLIVILGVLATQAAGGFVTIFSGIKGPLIKETERPSQGIISSAKNTGVVSFLLGFFGFVLDMFFNPGSWVSSLKNGIFLSLFGTLVFGGSAILRYFNLRLIHYYSGFAPWNYKHFLNHAVDRILLQRIGGGYVFIHRTLRDHLAKMKVPLK